MNQYTCALRSTSSRVAPTTERKTDEQGYTARCTGPAARCANARRSNCPCTMIPERITTRR
ncbi:hypothetical protein A2U01_0115435 [Trifolium medium]|uniref:Uncharacterized protein n=1 Tax=Trifolium medium TaxID=97028 RepID=A0A392W1I1_9FABA|nr:hypothetical protein [Trifolium medium]